MLGPPTRPNGLIWLARKTSFSRSATCFCLSPPRPGPSTYANFPRPASGASATSGSQKLCLLAAVHPKPFAGLLGRLLPLQINSNNPLNFIGQVNVMAVAPGGFLSAESITQQFTANNHDTIEIGEPPDQNLEPTNVVDHSNILQFTRDTDDEDTDP